MTGIVLSMLRARRAQALLVLVLSALAAAAATAGPAYSAAVDRAVVATEVAQSTRNERTVSIGVTVETRDVRPFDVTSSALGDLPGFDTVYTALFPVVGIEPTNRDASFLTFRDDVCPRLEMTAGRCLMGGGEVIVGEGTARRLDLRPGQSYDVAFASYDPMTRAWNPADEPAPLTVVGVYRPVDPTDAYWGRTAYFTPGFEGPPFIGRQTVDLIPHEQDERGVEAVAGPGAFSAAGLPALTAALDELTEDLTDGGSASSFARYDNTVAGLLERIERSREVSRQIVPVAGLPLVGLCWLVIFLAVAHGAGARRHEQALVALRGSPRLARWWLASGESLIAIAVGAPLGYLIGTVAVAATADARFDAGWSLAPAPGAITSALVAVAGAVVVGLLALRRDLATPVVDLLRRVPSRTGAWRSLAVEASAVVLAVVAALQLRGFDGSLVGLGTLVPGLVTLALAVVAGRLLAPAAARIGRAAIRRGRLGVGLGALHLARRPGAQRLFVLLAVAVALLGFATIAVDVAGHARADRAAVETGGDHTLQPRPGRRRDAARAVRAVDPAGAYAMAVASLNDEDRPRPAARRHARAGHVVAWRPDFGPYPAAETAPAAAAADRGAADGTGQRADADRRARPRPGGTPQLRLTVLLRPLPAVRRSGRPPVRCSTGAGQPTPGGRGMRRRMSGRRPGRRVDRRAAARPPRRPSSTCGRRPPAGCVVDAAAFGVVAAGCRASGATATRRPTGCACWCRAPVSTRSPTWALPGDVPGRAAGAGRPSGWWNRWARPTSTATQVRDRADRHGRPRCRGVRHRHARRPGVRRAGGHR